MIDGLRKFHEFLVELGVARNVLALPAPKTQLLDDGGSASAQMAIFSKTIVEPEIIAVARDLFASGFYSQAVDEACKALEKVVATLAGESLTGTGLMEKVFSPDNPVLAWSPRTTTSQKDEQKGYQRIYAGSMLGIRNPVTHEINWVTNADVALELLILLQHLVRKAKTSARV